MQTQKCRTCETDKPVSAFYLRSDKRGPQTECKSCAYFTNTKRLYGIDREQYDGMRKAQGFSCAICRVSEEDASSRLHIDHDHQTGRVRGLLCSDCNLMLGKAKDCADVLRAAIAYLT